MKAMSGCVESARYLRLPIRARKFCFLMSSGWVNFSVVLSKSDTMGDLAGLASVSLYLESSFLVYAGCDILMPCVVRSTFHPKMWETGQSSFRRYFVCKGRLVCPRNSGLLETTIKSSIVMMRSTNCVRSCGEVSMKLQLSLEMR